MLQIWLIPNQFGIEPTYEQKAFNVQTETDKLHLLASKDGRDDTFVIHSDAELLAARLTAGGSATHTFREGYGWLQVARGSIEIAGKTLNAGDGLQLEAEPTLTISSQDGAEFLLFDLE